MIKEKFSVNLASTMVGGGNMAGEMCPRTAIICQAARNKKAVATGNARAGT
jgi:hypothetical protein